MVFKKLGKRLKRFRGQEEEFKKTYKEVEGITYFPQGDYVDIMTEGASVLIDDIYNVRMSDSVQMKVVADKSRFILLFDKLVTVEVDRLKGLLTVFAVM